MTKEETRTMHETREDRRAELVRRYREFAMKGARCVLDLAATIVDAGKLPEPELDAFCAEVRLDRKGSTYRKLRYIGDRLDRFEPLADRMPCSWTTVYQLARLSHEDFERVARSDRFGPLMTLRDVEMIVQSAMPAPRAKKRDVAPAPTDDEELAPEAPADEEEGAAPPSEVAPEKSDEECAAMPTTPAEERAATVSDIKSLVGSASRRKAHREGDRARRP